MRLWSRLGNEKTRQFPEIAARARTVGARAQTQPLVLDGEIVALDAKGEPTGFQQLQGRIHLLSRDADAADTRVPRTRQPPVPTSPASRSSPSTSCATARPTFAIGRSLERRAALERVFSKNRIAAAAHQRAGRAATAARCTSDALERGWEGLIAKHADSLYKSGKRTPDWRKLKIVHEQEFVDRRLDRAAPDARLFRRAAARRLRRRPISSTSATPAPASTSASSPRVMKLLKPLETNECPFTNRPKTNERPHWVGPSWSRRSSSPSGPPTQSCAIRCTSACGTTRSRTRSGARKTRRSRAAFDDRRRRERRTRSRERRTTERRSADAERTSDESANRERARRPADRRSKRRARDGVARAARRRQLKVTNLHKVFWPKQKLTKGDLFRYYVAASRRCVLPAVADRPLVMKRFPNGVAAPPFYQHRAPGRAGRRPHRSRQRRRTAAADHRRRSEDAALHDAARGDLAGSRGSRASQHPEFADYAAFDLDPSDGVPVRARARRRALDSRRARRARRGRRRRRRRAPTACTSTSRCRPGRRTTPDCSTARSSRPSSRRSIRRWRRSSAAVAGARQARLHRLPAEHPRQDAGDRLQRARQRLRRRIDAASTWRKSTRGSTAASSRSGPFRPDWQRLVTCGPR